ncbi:MAG: TRAP transporter substrate-binding protein [Bradyrhizobium sp.]|uniref:TRAP transporter substrate-binding protein n=1 Tax=Bradyrhizobium sp. TaxID=376 RepID=UPI001D67A9FA|nr:TRAP transporter substrate-binding protein [Bradyrhizobium sp.]MBV9561662.1 TRAP transporter substrate-binding protein [Bradyrhizobium sp.]
MMFTRRAVVAGLATTGIGIGSLAHPFVSRALAAEYAWKFGHGFPANHPVHVFALEAAQKIKQDSGGRIEISVFPNSQLGGDSDMLGQVRSGAIDFFSTGGLIFATLVPVASMSGMGFAFRDIDAVWPAMDGELGAHIRAGFEKAGLHAFERIWNNGFREITTSRTVINGPADLIGFKIRVPVSQVYISLFKALGAAPTSINLAEVYTALQTGVVDGQENPLVVADTTKFYEVQKVCSLTNHVWDGSWIVTSNRSWEGIPDGVKKIVSDGFNDIAQRQRDAVTKLNADLAESLKQKGMAVNATDPGPFQETLRKAGSYAEWKRRFGDESWAILEKAAGRLA